jgi:hypothetical protein
MLAAGGTLAVAEGAQAAVRPNVSSDWHCETLTPPSRGLVYGDSCQGSGTGVGWLGTGVPSGPYYTDYRCTSFSATPEGIAYYQITANGCMYYSAGPYLQPQTG